MRTLKQCNKSTGFVFFILKGKKTMIEKIKNHWEEHKEKYYIGAICTLTTALAVSIYYNNKSLSTGSEFSDISQKVIVGNGILNRNNVEVKLLRRGHPGNKILCNQTGEVFASQQRAATANDISPSSLSEHLRGLRDSVDGLTFENLGEMV